MHNQRGEIVIGVMVVMMIVMMAGMTIFGGMHREHKHSHDDGAQHMRDNVDERAALPDQSEGK
jgi:hypothetical protein